MEGVVRLQQSQVFSSRDPSIDMKTETEHTQNTLKSQKVWFLTLGWYVFLFFFSFHFMLSFLKICNAICVYIGFHAREPLYLNSAVITWGLQSTSAQIVYLAVKKGNILVKILLLKIFIANYCHFLNPAV